MKTWKPWPGCECPDCGSSTEVLSDADTPDGYTTDGDALRCSDPSCPRHTEALGHTTVYAEDDVCDQFEGWPINDNDKPYNPHVANAGRQPEPVADRLDAASRQSRSDALLNWIVMRLTTCDGIPMGVGGDTATEIVNKIQSSAKVDFQKGARSAE